MAIASIPFKNTNYFSQLICDYLDNVQNLNVFYNRFPSIENFKYQIEEKLSRFNHGNRQHLVEVLKLQYQHLETSSLTQKHIAHLANNKTFTVTTGHQLNVFTGPTYFLYKIVSTINLAKQLKANYPNYNFVPVYWMASEDHDFEEINYFNFKGSKIQWHSNQQGAVGHFKTEGMSSVYNVVASVFGDGKRGDYLKDLFQKAYLNHNNLADATRFLVNELFGDYGLVILDADDKKLKTLFSPYVKKELLEQTAFHSVATTNHQLEELNLKVQVNPRDINLFYIDNNLRGRITFKDEIFEVVNTNISWNEDELIKHLETYPERFSPNVIMRPLYQEVILPNLCYIGGGGELAYWFQLKANFEAQKVTFPMLLLRNSVLIKSEKQAKKQQRLKLKNKDLFLKRYDLLTTKTKELSEISIDFSPQIKHLEKQFDALELLAKQTDTSFLGAVKAQEAKQIKGLKHLEKRLLKAQKRQLSDVLNRITELQEQLFPNQSLQERQLNFSELYLEYGNDLIPKLLEHLKPLELQFNILEL